MEKNKLTSAICDMEDIKQSIKMSGLWNHPKDSDGTEITLGDCIEDVLDFLKETEPDYVLILPWNLKDEIIEQMNYINNWGGKFVIPIPKVSII